MPDPGRSSPTLEDAIILAAEAHRGQVYPSPEPEPYICHPLRVMLAVRTETEQVAARRPRRPSLGSSAT